MKQFFALIAMLIVLSVSAYSQLPVGKIAISSAIGNTNELGGSYAFTESMRLNGGIDIQDSKTFGTSYGLNASMWFYKPAVESITYFYGGGFSYSHSSGGAQKTIRLNLQSGAEYWFNSRFAWGAFTGLYISSVKNWGTSTAAFGTIGVNTTLTWWFN